MPKYARISLPLELADDLVDVRLAVRPMQTRGSSPAEILSLAVEYINTGSAAVSVIVGAETVRRLVAGILKRRHPTDPDKITLEITTGGERKTLTVDRSEPGAEEEAFRFFSEVFGI